ncbi:MAG: hypothetical protein KJO65_08055 [Gemmatimonadetes bacterium]|nr:hypothetical protein [Gemmatimonadota bacterium]
MEELIFFAVIIFFSILESIARSRRAKKGEGQADGPLPDPGEWEARFPELELGRTSLPGDDDLPTYDDDPSYDDMLEQQRVEQRRSRDGETLERYTRPRGTDQPARPSPSRTRPAPAPSRPSSETMLPGDLLEQLEALARGGTVEREDARTIEMPKQSPPLPAPIERTEVGTGHGSTDPVGSRSPYGSASSSGPVGSTAPIGSRPPVGAGAITRRPEHYIHRSHADYGTDPSSRAPSAEDGLDPLAEYLDADGVAVRSQLFGGREALRQAFVVKEVLGPPKALRGDDPAF